MSSAALVFLLLTLALPDASDAAWCICRSDAATTALQKTLDYACGAGADCSSILQNGACYNPNTVLAHCSYAANSYYQRKGQTQDACDFTGTAMITTSDPGVNGCTFPATPSAAGTSTTSTSTLPNSTTTPNTFTPTTGTGGSLGGLGPTGTTSFDGSDGGLLPNKGRAPLLLLAILISPLVLLRI